MQLIRPPRDETRRDIRPVDVTAWDKKLVRGGAMEYADLENLLLDVQWEPNWRDEADKNAAYYDGHQKTREQMRLEKEGQPVAVVNLISRTVNAMLGNEVRGRVSWRLSADSDEEYGEVSDALQVKLTQAQRETCADMAISEAYASQTKAGLGWCEVSRVADPFSKIRYRVAAVHRNEIWWDWRAKALDLSDARWLLRKQWHDLDDLEVLLPQFRSLFQFYGRSTLGSISIGEAVFRVDQWSRYESERAAFRVPSEEWFDTARKRVATYEVWYRVFKPVVAVVMADGPAVEYDKNNPLHTEAIRRGIAKLMRLPKRTLRSALFVGPHRLFDDEVKGDKFPYIPFWGFRQDDDRSPYSIVSGMRYPQDEYNARRSRLMWLLQAAQVIVEEDALATRYNNLFDLAAEVRRPDGMIVLNKTRLREKAIEIARHVELPAEQVAVMADAKALIMEQPGVSEALMGDKVPGVTSGVAFGQLVQQSANAVGDHDDNYRFGRRGVGELLADLIIDDHKRPNIPVRVGSGSTQRVVVLNQWDPKTQTLRNAVEDAAINVALDEAPSTPAYKMNQRQQIGDVLKVAGNVPAVQAVMIPAFIESTDLPNRDSDARWLRRQFGVPQPGDRESMRKDEELRGQQQAEQAKLQQRATEAELNDKEASAAQKASAAELNKARVAQIAQQIGQAARAEADAANDEDAAIERASQEAGGPQARPTRQA